MWHEQTIDFAGFLSGTVHPEYPEDWEKITYYTVDVIKPDSWTPEFFNVTVKVKQTVTADRQLKYNPKRADKSQSVLCSTGLLFEVSWRLTRALMA